MAERIGIFGGTFDPPHLGHLILASECRWQLGLDRVLWVVTPYPPHKLNSSITDPIHRLEMVRLAIAGDPWFELSTVEFDRPPPHYTLDTVLVLRQQYPTSELFLLMGSDSLRLLVTWHRPADLVAQCDALGVMRRPGETVHLTSLETVLPGIKDKVHFVDAPLLQIASREIRRRVAQGLEFRYFVSPAVYDYIQQNQLYRNFPSISS